LVAVGAAVLDQRGEGHKVVLQELSVVSLQIFSATVPKESFQQPSVVGRQLIRLLVLVDRLQSLSQPGNGHTTEVGNAGLVV